MPALIAGRLKDVSMVMIKNEISGWKYLLSFTTLLLLVTFPACSQNIDDAKEAYDRGDYEAALQTLRPLAEKGDASAQNNLGFMYDEGQGVPQDYGEALKWYRKASEQGHAYAQYNLGFMYQKGQGVPQDYVLSVKW